VDRASTGVLAGLGLSATALAVAPLLMPESYSWVSNTTSESGAQGTSGAWVARLGFTLFGTAVLALALRRPPGWGPWAARLHGAVGLFLIGCAVFSTRSWVPGAPYDRTEDLLHSVAATAAPFAFVLGLVAGAAARRRSGVPALRPIDGLALGGSILVPLTMAMAPGVEGLVQRAMFAVLYCWYGSEALRGGRLRAPRRAAASRHGDTGGRDGAPAPARAREVAAGQLDFGQEPDPDLRRRRRPGVMRAAVPPGRGTRRGT
jgi:hypothetical protein